MSTSTRGSFSSRIGFIAAAAGSAVGLGNIWKFPYEVGNYGGAAFLIIYVLCAFIICMPIMVAEIAMGRNAQLNPFGTYKKLGGKGWAWAGFFGILAGVMILSFYNVVAGWAFGYFLQISFGDLLAQGDYGAYFGRYVANVGDNMVFSLAFMVLTALIVVGGVQKGIERWTKILMPALISIILVLIIYGLTLDNAFKGIEFYLVPDFGKINMEVLYKALSQAFFSLSLGMGALITYGSYFSKKDNIVSSAALVTTADLSIAFLAGMLIFPLVFFQGIAPTEGPGLVFVALPGIFEAMGPILGRVVGGGFFLLLCFAALTSTISLLEVPVAFVTDQFKTGRKKTVWLLAGLIFVIGLPSMLSQGAINSLTYFASYGESKGYITEVIDSSRHNINRNATIDTFYTLNNNDPNNYPLQKEIIKSNSDERIVVTNISIDSNKNISSLTISGDNGESILTGVHLTEIKWNYTPSNSFMTVVIDIFSDIALPLGGFLISIFVAYKWKIARFSDELEHGHPKFRGTWEEKFVTIMLSTLSPLIVGFIVLATILERFAGISLF